MATYFLKIFLLFAVAISQTIGGVSCCCLGRVVTESLLAGLSGDAPRVDDLYLLEARSSCPKCAARRAIGSKVKSTAREKKSCHLPHLGADDECRCVKLELNSITSSDPEFVDSFSHLKAKLHSESFDEQSLTSFRTKDLKIPPRYGGRSWQSIACVWKN